MSNRNRFFQSSNPFASEERFKNVLDGGSIAQDRMTVAGAVNKSLILGAILVVSSLLSFMYIQNMALIYFGIFGGLAVLLATYFKPEWSPITAPVYAAIEGLAIGGISALYAEALGPGIIFNALGLTMFALVAMLAAYKTGLIRPTERFRSILVTATGAIFLIYMVNMGLGLFGASVPFIHSTGPLGIGISVVIVIVAALNLILDFEAFEMGERSGAPTYMEWFSAMSLLVTLVWLYLELLRLLSKIQSD